MSVSEDDASSKSSSVSSSYRSPRAHNRSHRSILVRTGSRSFAGTRLEADGWKDKRRIPRIEHELWHIFTYYTLQSDPMAPALMRTSTFLSFAKDCMLLEPRLRKGDVDVVIVSVVPSQHHQISHTHSSPCQTGSPTKRVRSPSASSPSKQPPSSLSFAAFLQVLQTLAPRLYPECKSDSRAFKRLVLEDVLVYAKRRKPFTHLKRALTRAEDPLVRQLMAKMGNALKRVFFSYARCNDVGRLPSPSTAAAGASQSPPTSPPLVPSATTPPPSHTLSQMSEYHHLSMSAGQLSSSDSTPLTYSDFISFTRDFQLGVHSGTQTPITTAQCAECYLSIAPPYSNINEPIPSIDEAAFIRTLTALAMRWSEAFDGCVSPLNRAKGFLLYMWRVVDAQRRLIAEIGEFNTHLRHTHSREVSFDLWGANLLCHQVKEMWQHDDFVEYLAEPLKTSPPLLSTLQQLTAMSDDESSTQDLKELNALAPCSSPTEGGTLVLYTSHLRRLFEESPEVRDVVANCLSVMSPLKSPRGSTRADLGKEFEEAAVA